MGVGDTSERDRVALGEYVKRRRQRLGVPLEAMAEAGGVSHPTWMRVERGQTVRAQTYLGVERAFGWPPGSVEAYLRDRTSPTPTEGSRRTVPDYVEIGRQVYESDLPDATKAELLMGLLERHPVNADPADVTGPAAQPHGAGDLPEPESRTS